MGRNRIFRVGDPMVVLDMSQNTIKSIIWTYTQIGYIRLIKKTKKFEDRTYRVVKHTGKQSPSISNLVVYDHNINKEIVIKASNTKERIYRAVLSMDKQVFTANHIKKISKAPLSTVYKTLKSLTDRGVIVVEVGGYIQYFLLCDEYQNILERR